VKKTGRDNYISGRYMFGGVASDISAMLWRMFKYLDAPKRGSRLDTPIPFTKRTRRSIFAERPIRNSYGHFLAYVI
jgi:pyruvate/2-oxoglutarate/acetoin dehydrogenase E1 component